jgi:hypothetical protein
LRNNFESLPDFSDCASVPGKTSDFREPQPMRGSAISRNSPAWLTFRTMGLPVDLIHAALGLTLLVVLALAGDIAVSGGK